MEDLTQPIEQKPIPKIELEGTKHPKAFILTILIIGLLFGVIAIVMVMENKTLHTELNSMNNTNNTAELSKAYNTGIMVTLIQVINTTNDCQITSVTLGNGTRQLVDVDCVRKILKDQNITLN